MKGMLYLAEKEAAAAARVPVRKGRYRLLCIGIIALALIPFFRLGAVTLFDVDEAVFAQATKEMVQGGDWITPTYNGATRYDKPIFFYWLMAASYRVFGINEFGARFPSALSGLLLGIAVFFFMRRFGGEQKALYAVLSLSLSLYFLVYSHAAVTDMALALFISLSLFSFYCSIDGDRRFLYGFYLFSALAFLTKGLIGLIFPFGIAFLYLLIRGGLRGTGRMFSVKGMLLFFVVSAPWYAAQLAINGREFVQQFFIKHHFMRYTGVISGHKGPFYYYLPVLMIGFFPWVAFLPAGVKEVLRKKDGPGIFACIWGASIAVFFSFSTTKLPNYILPALPAAALLAAYGLDVQGSSRRDYAYGFISLVGILSVIALAFGRRYLANAGEQGAAWIFVLAGLMLALAVLGAYALYAKKKLPGLLAVFMLLFLSVLSLNALPLASRRLQGALYRFSLYAREELRGDERIVTYRLNNPSIVFYSGHRVTVAGSAGDLRASSNRSARLAIAKRKDTATMQEAGFFPLERDGEYALFEKKRR